MAALAIQGGVMARIQKQQSSKRPAPRVRRSSEKRATRTPEPPEVFEVGNGGVLVRADFHEPETREDVYDISIRWLQSPEDLIEFMDQFSGLAAEISVLQERFVDSVSEQLEEARRQPTEPRRIRALEARLAAAPEDADDEGRQWLTTVGKRYFKSVSDMGGQKNSEGFRVTNSVIWRCGTAIHELPVTRT